MVSGQDRSSGRATGLLHRQRDLTDAVWVAIIPGSLMFMALQVLAAVNTGQVGVDSHAYWLAARFPESWYTRPPGGRDAFLYSPAFAQLLRPLGGLTWPMFQSVWAISEIVVLTLLLAPLGRRKALTIAPLFVTEILLGNVYIFLAAALVMGLRNVPEALAFPMLTKITPGVTGVWFLVRRQWYSAARSFGCTALVFAVSCAIAPEAWIAWGQFLVQHSESRGAVTALRPAAALGIVIWSARTGRAWLLAPALLLACPITNGYAPLAALSAIPRLLQLERSGVLDRNEGAVEAALP